MNPFFDNLFISDIGDAFDNKILNGKREEFIKKHKFGMNDLVAWFDKIDEQSKDKKIIIDALYFCYKSETITKTIGMSEPHPEGLPVGGYLDYAFYKKLWRVLSEAAKIEIFPYLPGKVQTDDMLQFYFENAIKYNKRPEINNYHGPKPSKKVLEWLVENAIGTIRNWKKEWWDEDLKYKVISKEPTAIFYLPENMLSIQEIRDFLKEHGKTQSRYISSLYNALSESFKEDPEIIARFWHLSGGLKDLSRNYFNIWTYEQVLKYLELYPEYSLSRTDWKSFPDKFKDKKFIDAAIKSRKLAESILLDESISLSTEQIKELLVQPMSDADRARVFIKYKGKIPKKELLDLVGVNFAGIDYLPNKERREIMDEDMVNHLLDTNDPLFLRKKTNWPKDIDATNDMILKFIVNDLNATKIKSRIDFLNEDDYIYLILEWRNKYSKMTQYSTSYGEKIINDIFKSGYGEVSEEIKKLVDEAEPNTTYKAFKDALNLFIF